MLSLAIFSPNWYLANNPDVAWAVMFGQTTPETHFVNQGMHEGRLPSGIFKPDFYLRYNPDVAQALGNTTAAAVTHFMTSGHEEGRAFHPSINLGKYLAANPDVAQAVAQSGGQMSALEHLVMYGITEGRSLGNGVSLAQFANDPGFKLMMGQGNHLMALTRVGDAAPFLPGFQAPEGWVIPANQFIPRKFVPATGEKLQIPSYIAIPDWLKENPEYYEIVPATAPESARSLDIGSVLSGAGIADAAYPASESPKAAWHEGPDLSAELLTLIGAGSADAAGVF